MNETMDVGEPSYTTSGDNLNTQGTFTSCIRFLFHALFLIILLSYTSYIYKRNKCSQSSLPPTTDPTTDSDDDDYHFTRLSQGIGDNVLATFRTFLYYEVVMFLKGKTNVDNYVFGCSICLADYKLAEVIRLLPESGHVFHVRCIDRWLKVHPTCPAWRNLPLPTITDLA